MKRVVMIALLALSIAGAVAAGEQPAAGPYVPGFGEFMSATQVRHAKLWFAGEAENWDLAAYEVDEIREGLDDAAKFHPVHKNVPVAEMIKSNLDAPLREVEAAIKAKDKSDFARAFDGLTTACNACHAGASYGFIKVQRPTVPPVSNQVFAPSGK
jgi:hypothetical protein